MMSEVHTISTFPLDIKSFEILDLKIHGQVDVELVLKWLPQIFIKYGNTLIDMSIYLYICVYLYLTQWRAFSGLLSGPLFFLILLKTK